MDKKKVIITGVLGQDGYYMSKLLFDKGYEIYGTVRNFQQMNTGPRGITLVPIDLLNKSQVIDLVELIQPDEIYNFAAVSNVFDAWSDMDTTFDVNIKIPQYFLEAIISKSPHTKFLQASSALVFGRDESGWQNEKTIRCPIYPYGVSKNLVDGLISEARITHGIKACSAIFFNHESPRRGDNFFSKKIAKAVANIKNDHRYIIPVGNITAYRDYGYAPDYMEAAYLMLQAENPKDYVVGTGELIMMGDYIKKCFEYVGLNYENYVHVDAALYRENDTKILRADASLIRKELGWEPKTSIDDLVKIMMEDALRADQRTKNKD